MMGSNPSRSPVQPFQAVDPLRVPLTSRETTSSSERDRQPSPLPVHPKPKPKLDWHLPPDTRDASFQPHWPSNPQKYSVRHFYDTNRRVFDISSDSVDTKSSHYVHQKESDTISFEGTNSAIYESAHVQSSLEGQFHSCINLSTSEEIDQVTKEIASIHTKADEHFQNEVNKVSKAGEKTTKMIVDDTHRIQQDLLVYGKRREKEYEDLYSEYLQKYIAVLNEWKSKQLAHLQDEMDRCEEDILKESRHRISHVNDEINVLREDILRSTIDKVSQETKRIVEKLQSKSLHHLGTESTTKIRLTIHGNVGNKLPGQQGNFDKKSGRSS